MEKNKILKELIKVFSVEDCFLNEAMYIIFVTIRQKKLNKLTTCLRKGKKEKNNDHSSETLE